MKGPEEVLQMSRLTTKPAKWLMRLAKTRISLGIHPVWSETSLSAWRKLESLATHWAPSEDSDPPGQRPAKTLIRLGRSPGWSVFAGRTCHFVGFVMRRLKGSLQPSSSNNEKFSKLWKSQTVDTFIWADHQHSDQLRGSYKLQNWGLSPHNHAKQDKNKQYQNNRLRTVIKSKTCLNVHKVRHGFLCSKYTEVVSLTESKLLKTLIYNKSIL